jgi:hypothetical protein
LHLDVRDRSSLKKHLLAKSLTCDVGPFWKRDPDDWIQLSFLRWSEAIPV